MKTHRIRTLAFALGLFLLVTATVLAFTVGNVDGVWGWVDGVTETSSTPVDGGGATCSRWATGPGDSPTTWSNWDRSVQTGSASDENQVRYGHDAYLSSGRWYERTCDNTAFGEQSGFGFDGNNGPITPLMDSPFYLGKFTHYNNPIYADNALSSVDLTVSVPIQCTAEEGGGTTTFTFSANFELDETSNTAGTCVYPGSTVCPDRVLITQPQASSFYCGTQVYTVNILGFQPGASCDQIYTGTTASVFYTEEQQDNQACLWAEIDAPSADVSLTKQCSIYSTGTVYSLLATNAGTGHGTGRQDC